MKKILFFLSTLVSLFLNNSCCFAQAGLVYTVVGGGSSTAEGIPATATMLSTATGIGVDGAGNIYYGDQTYKVRKIDAVTGLVNTVVGTGTSGYSGDGGAAISAQIGQYRALFVDKPGNIYIADHSNNVVRKVDAITGIINTIAGGGSSYADGIPATNAKIDEQLSVFVDGAGNVYCSGNNSIRKIDATTGIISTVAGGGTSTADGVPATMAMISSGVKSVSLDSMGNIYIISHDGRPIRRVDAMTGLIYTIAGGGSSSADGIPATASSLSDAHSCKVDAAGNLFIADWSASKIRRIDAVTGIITTIAGGGSSTMEGVPALSAQVHPYQICLDAVGGNIYYSNFGDRIRKFSYSPIYGSSTKSVGHTDSFKISVTKLCNGPQLVSATYNYIPGRYFKTDYGDGTVDSTVINKGYSYGGYVTLNHVYNAPGTYTINQVLYDGSTAVDTNAITYNYQFCRTLPVKLYYEGNGNNMKDVGESYMSLPSVAEVDSNGVKVGYISATGGFDYNAYAPPGAKYSFKLAAKPGNLIVTNPPSGVINDTVSSVITTSPDKYFGLTCPISKGFDLSINTVVPVTGVNDQWGNMYISNTDCAGSSATVTLYFSPKWIFSIPEANPKPTTVTSNTATWTLGSISANDPKPVDLYYVLRDNPKTGPLKIRDTVHSYFIVTPTTGDMKPSDNIVIRNDTIRAGCDPNEMFVDPPGCISSGTSQLQYTINFENTGNDTAHNIYVMDTLSDFVDINTLRIVMASSNMNIGVLKDAGHNVVRFEFPNINLLDSSHHDACDGSVIFNINMNAGLVNGTNIFNHAGIFFDVNDVVMTNTVENIIGCPLIVHGISNQNNVELYPNPTTDELGVRTNKFAFTSLTITNTIGQVIMQQTVSQTEIKVDVKALPAGLYYISLKGQDGIAVQKFIKM